MSFIIGAIFIVIGFLVSLFTWFAAGMSDVPSAEGSWVPAGIGLIMGLFVISSHWWHVTW